jgi:hypothetical protein
MMRFRSKPVEIEAIQFTGDNEAEVIDFTDGHFHVLADDDRENCDDPEATAEVFDDLHSTWVLVYTGNWIIRGTKREYYPCNEEVFAQKYEEV